MLKKDEGIIVNLKFKSNLSKEEINKITEIRKEELENTEGLVSLICHYNEETHTIGGTYIFKNILYARTYLEDFLTNGIGPKYGVIPTTLKIDIGTIKNEIVGDFLKEKL